MGWSRTSRVRGAGRTSAFIAGLALLSAAAYSAAQNVAETGSTLIYPVVPGLGWLLREGRSCSAHDGGRHGLRGRHPLRPSQGRFRSAHRTRICPTRRPWPTRTSSTYRWRSPRRWWWPICLSCGALPLKLSGPVLAGIYSGKVREWDAAPIAALNRGVHLPHHAIVPVRRADGSGDTFIFTQFLTFSTPDVHLSAASDLLYDWETKIGYGTTVPWPSVAGRPDRNRQSGHAADNRRHSVCARLSWRKLRRPMRIRPALTSRC